MKYNANFNRLAFSPVLFRPHSIYLATMCHLLFIYFYSSFFFSCVCVIKLKISNLLFDERNSTIWKWRSNAEQQFIFIFLSSDRRRLEAMTFFLFKKRQTKTKRIMRIRKRVSGISAFDPIHLCARCATKRRWNDLFHSKNRTTQRSGEKTVAFCCWISST